MFRECFTIHSFVENLSLIKKYIKLCYIVLRNLIIFWNIYCGHWNCSQWFYINSCFSVLSRVLQIGFSIAVNKISVDQALQLWKTSIFYWQQYFAIFFYECLNAQFSPLCVQGGQIRGENICWIRLRKCGCTHLTWPALLSSWWLGRKK